MVTMVILLLFKNYCLLFSDYPVYHDFLGLWASGPGKDPKDANGKEIKAMPWER